MRKRVLSVLLALLMACSLLPVPALAEEAAIVPEEAVSVEETASAETFVPGPEAESLVLGIDLLPGMVGVREVEGEGPADTRIDARPESRCLAAQPAEVQHGIHEQVGMLERIGVEAAASGLPRIGRTGIIAEGQLGAEGEGLGEVVAQPQCALESEQVSRLAVLPVGERIFVNVEGRGPLDCEGHAVGMAGDRLRRGHKRPRQKQGTDT